MHNKKCAPIYHGRDYVYYREVSISKKPTIITRWSWAVDAGIASRKQPRVAGDPVG